ncbi:hypothetical protein SLE2022_312440 [Rubroshorea leprosula]
MLEPREADIPVLFLVLVVLPLVAYFLLGKWSEAAKKQERISLLAQLAAEEACRAEAMAAASVIPLVPSVKNGLHVCARCSGPATTRCSRCKAVRYCSGRCQIIHWRQIHKQECLQMETSGSSASPKFAPFEDSVLLGDSMNEQFFGYLNKHAVVGKEPSDNLIHSSINTGALSSVNCSQVDSSKSSLCERRISDKKVSWKSNKEISRKEDTAGFDSCDYATRRRASNLSSANSSTSQDAFIRHKLRSNDSTLSEEISKQRNADGTNVHLYGDGERSTVNENHTYQAQHGDLPEPRSNGECSSSSYLEKPGATGHETENNVVLNKGNLVHNTFHDETVDLNCSELTRSKGGTSKGSLPAGTKTSKLPKSPIKICREQPCSEIGGKEQVGDESKISRMQGGIPVQVSNGVGKMDIMKMMGLRKSTKLSRQDAPEFFGNKPKKMKMLFPYEEFVKLFQYEVFGLSPRGLLNCGNSCYANAVLQCLTGTRPLIIYLLRKIHSRACYGKDWCLMCELEQHVMMLRESGGALSPSRILSHMRSINYQIGDGSQEDAHEFLRLLVASMQSICLEGLGGEEKVDSRLQETTFIQHTFGGRLRSKVKCLRCYHESERYENIMDLTLEIYGRVESLEDALTQFTNAEDLDGENMYRCGRCAAYVRARKQLSIHEAPNILTIVLKRFQEGRYGKINKCISFPELLDMVPFMTGTVDIPPLYLLYAVVVHLDTLNASFSGHYVSYVKDLQDNWFRIDDTEVHPVSISQVMSEGAYILFYTRSSPRPQRALTEKAWRKQASVLARHSTSKSEKPSCAVQSESNGNFVVSEPYSDLRPEVATGFANQMSNGILRRSANMMETYQEPAGVEFSDATSSDWSLFTSSDEASFTTESTRDSFSTVDYADMSNADPFSIFNNLYAPESSSCNTVSCRLFSNTSAQTRYILEEKGYVVESYLSPQPVNGALTARNLKRVSGSSGEFHSDSNHGMFVKYGSNPKYPLNQTSGHCKP